MTLSPRRAALIAVGAAAGAALRWVTADELLAVGGRFPWGILTVNVVGSAVLGLALVEARRHPDRESLLVDGIGTGFCGGLTTFSAFAVDSANLLRDGEGAVALGYVALTMIAGIAAVSLAVAGARRLGRGTPP